jgi:hypothetical protein
MGLTCVYSETAFTCGFCNAEVEGDQRTWCSGALQSGCPALVPNLGEACASQGLVCDYNACVTDEAFHSLGIGLLCQDGTWQYATIECPD